MKVLHFVIIFMRIVVMPIHCGFQQKHFLFCRCQFQCSLFNFLVGSHVITSCRESSLLFRASFPWAICWDLQGKVIVIEAKGIELGPVCGTESAFVGGKKKVVTKLTCFLAHLNCACHAWMELNKKFSVEMRYKENRSLKKCQTAAKLQFCWMWFPLRFFPPCQRSCCIYNLHWCHYTFWTMGEGSQDEFSNGQMYGGNSL